MSDDTISALARVIRARYDQCPPDRYPTEDALAEYIAKHATEEGLAVVSLPQPADPDSYDFGDYCDAAWFSVDDDLESLSVSVHENEFVRLDTDDELSPEGARVVAAALLAAADTADRIDDALAVGSLEVQS